MELTKENCAVGLVVQCKWRETYITADTPDVYDEIGVISQICDEVFDGSGWAGIKINWLNTALHNTRRQKGDWSFYGGIFEIVENETSKELIAKIQDQQRRKEFAEKYL